MAPGVFLYLASPSSLANAGATTWQPSSSAKAGDPPRKKNPKPRHSTVSGCLPSGDSIPPGLLHFLGHARKADVAHVGPFHHVNHMLSHVTRVIAYPLQRTQHPEDVQYPADRARVFHHVGHHFTHRGLVFAIHHLVFTSHFQRLLAVIAGEGVQGLLYHLVYVITDVTALDVAARRLAFLD